MQYRDEHITKQLIIYFIEDHYEEGAFFYINYIADKIVITKIKPFEFIEQDVIDYNSGDEKVMGVIDDVSLSHYLNTMMYFHNQIGSTQHNFPDLWRVMKFGRVTDDNIRWCVENDKLYGVKVKRVTPK